MLKVEDVTKKYGKVFANENVNISAEAGRAALLLGPNGAGKSTIIKCIAGLLRYSGKIEIGGYPNKSLEAKRMIGYIPEFPAIYDLLTLGEHLEFIRRAYKVEDDGYGDALIERFELSDKKDKLGKELSKGMQQKLSICCALVHRPKMIIFDEPMVGLDPHAIKELRTIFTELKNDGAALLISTHMLDSIENCWDDAYIMNKGKVAARVTAEEGNESIEELFFRITEGGKGQ